MNFMEMIGDIWQWWPILSNLAIGYFCIRAFFRGFSKKVEPMHYLRCDLYGKLYKSTPMIWLTIVGLGRWTVRYCCEDDLIDNLLWLRVQTVLVLVRFLSIAVNHTDTTLEPRLMWIRSILSHSKFNQVWNSRSFGVTRGHFDYITFFSDSDARIK